MRSSLRSGWSTPRYPVQFGAWPGLTPRSSGSGSDVCVSLRTRRPRAPRSRRPRAAASPCSTPPTRTARHPAAASSCSPARWAATPIRADGRGSSPRAGWHGPLAAGFRTAEPRRSRRTARPASERSPAERLTSTCSTRPTLGLPWATSMRALARLVDRGLVRRVGVANVNRTQLDEALELAPVAAVQVALSPLDDRAIRGGVLERCDELGLTLLAHSPLGGPRRARSAASPQRAGGDRRRSRRHARGGGARLAALALAVGRGDSRGRPPGERTLIGEGGDARARRGRTRGSDRRVRGRVAARPPLGVARLSGRGGRGRDGDPRRGQESDRRRLRRAWSRSAEPRRARWFAACPRGGSRRHSSPPVSGVPSSTTPT